MQLRAPFFLGFRWYIEMSSQAFSGPRFIGFFSPLIPLASPFNIPHQASSIRLPSLSSTICPPRSSFSPSLRASTLPNMSTAATLKLVDEHRHTKGSCVPLLEPNTHVGTTQTLSPYAWGPNHFPKRAMGLAPHHNKPTCRRSSSVRARRSAQTLLHELCLLRWGG